MESLLRLTEVEKRVGLKRSALYKLIEISEFPRPIRLTSKAVAWPASEVSNWIDARIAASRQGKAA